MVMIEPYDHSEIEKKWRENWQKDQTYTTDLTKNEKAFYCLDMFPYPSGEGLHVGHWRGYVMSDFYARYQRLQGKNVFHPMGFDAFGLPAENAAIKSETHPKEFTQRAIKTFTAQLSQMGASYDWSKKIVTSDPEYYRWTQWLFLQLFKHSLAEKRKSLVNWCPKDQTVLANEQVIDGCCERCGTVVTKKELDQWYFKTTAMAEELYGGLDGVKWPERVKTLQRNWIGKSKGANVKFSVVNSRFSIEVFTTRPDTLFGVTALVLSPEHPLVSKLTTQESNEKVEEYLEGVASKTNIDRMQAKETEKTAVFTGTYATHPLTNENIPIWLADYVLADYASGAVMCVPAHDERDYQFAKTHNLPIKQVISPTAVSDANLPYIGQGIIISSKGYNGLNSNKASENIVADLTNAAKGEQKTIYRLRDWLVSRQRYWGAPIPIVYDPDGKAYAVKDEHLPLLLPDDVDFLPGGESPIARSKEYAMRAEKLYGVGWRFETDTLDTFVDSSWYFFRYLSPTDSSQPFDKDLVKNWLPVDFYVGGIEHATLHLLYARFICRFLAKFGYIDSSIAEPFSQLFNIGMVNMHGAKMSKSKDNVVSADQLVEHYGADTLRGYELFIGPMDVEAEWNPQGVNGIHRFLIKLWKVSQSCQDIEASDENNQEFQRYLHSISQMINQHRLNTVLAQAMTFLQYLHTQPKVSKKLLENFLITLSPIFPFICEELWQKFGHDQSIGQESWPELAEVANYLELSVRINNKHVYSIPVRGDESEEETLELIKQSPPPSQKDKLLKLLEPNTRRVYKTGSFINFVVHS